MNNKLIIVIGAYGSGKSEYSVNLAKQYKETHEKVTLVDLDVINPYFRSRNVKKDFAKEGIEVISPEGEFSHADLPMLSPKIRGAVNDRSKLVILDVGGDPTGCRAVKRFHNDIKRRGAETIFVVNTKRPFTNNEENIKEMIMELEFASGLKINEMVCNTNLMDLTTQEIVENGIDIIGNVSKEKEIKFDKYLVLDKKEIDIPDCILNKKKILIQHYLKKPWESTNKIPTRGI